MANEKPLAIISGAGDGLGNALLNRLEQGGFHVVGLRRNAPKGQNKILSIDLTDETAMAKQLQDLIETWGPPKVVVHNPATLVIQPFQETSLEDIERLWRSMSLSAAILGQGVLMPMVRGGGGAFLVSGATASLRGAARFSAFASAKFALRGLTQSLAREFQPFGVHVVHFILDGIIDTAASRDLHALDPSKMMKPEDIAEIYWQTAHQPRSTWVHEMDLRPQSESF